MATQEQYEIALKAMRVVRKELSRFTMEWCSENGHGPDDDILHDAIEKLDTHVHGFFDEMAVRVLERDYGLENGKAKAAVKKIKDLI